MTSHRRLSDSEIEQLLAGGTPRGGEAIDQDLAGFARDLRAACRGAIPSETAQAHIAAAAAATPAGPGPSRLAIRQPKPSWRRRTVFSSIFASMTAKVLGISVAAMAATGGLAAANALPAPAQQAVASAASTIGLHLPDPAEHEVTGTVSGTVRDDRGEGDDRGGVTGTMGDEPTGTVHGDDGEDVTGTVTGTATASVNHGNCVSWAAANATSLGMTGDLKGRFISALAHDKTALSAKVATGGTPDPACVAAIAKAEAAAASAKPGDDQEDGVTGTVTSTVTGDDGKKGQDDQGEDSGNHGQVTATASGDNAQGDENHSKGSSGSDPGKGTTSGHGD